MMEDNLEYIDDFEWESMLHSGEFSNGDIRQLLREREAAKERIVELESRLDLGTGNMYDVVVCENQKLREKVAELEAQLRLISGGNTMIVKKDGDSWAFVLPDFVDLQTSPAYFGGESLDKDCNKVFDELLIAWLL